MNGHIERRKSEELLSSLGRKASRFRKAFCIITYNKAFRKIKLKSSTELLAQDLFLRQKEAKGSENSVTLGCVLWRTIKKRRNIILRF